MKTLSRRKDFSFAGLESIIIDNKIDSFCQMGIKEYLFLLDKRVVIL
jgi:hypothetical protein